MLIRFPWTAVNKLGDTWLVGGATGCGLAGRSNLSLGSENVQFVAVVLRVPKKPWQSDIWWVNNTRYSSLSLLDSDSREKVASSSPSKFYVHSRNQHVRISSVHGIISPPCGYRFFHSISTRWCCLCGTCNNDSLRTDHRIIVVLPLLFGVVFGFLENFLNWRLLGCGQYRVCCWGLLNRVVPCSRLVVVVVGLFSLSLHCILDLLELLPSASSCQFRARNYPLKTPVNDVGKMQPVSSKNRSLESK